MESNTISGLLDWGLGKIGTSLFANSVGIANTASDVAQATAGLAADKLIELNNPNSNFNMYVSLHLDDLRYKSLDLVTKETWEDFHGTSYNYITKNDIRAALIIMAQRDNIHITK